MGPLIKKIIQSFLKHSTWKNQIPQHHSAIAITKTVFELHSCSFKMNNISIS